jgi:4-amino-4-deoxy-L-arabinose transferase-like glycosyltransferase
MLFIPVAAVFGITATSVRLFTVSLATLSLAAYYLFARSLFRRPGVAAIGVFLLAFDPSFIFYSRVDFAPSVLMFVLKGARFGC